MKPSLHAKPSQSTARASNRVNDPEAVPFRPATDEAQADPKPCHWWQFRHCDDAKARGDELPPDAPKQGAVIAIDVSTHTAYLYRDGELVDQSPAATGSGKFLKKGRQMWLFHTPQGHLKVLRKVVDPVWTKPDWAFIEDGDRVPPPDSPKRKVRGHLGKYALDLGDGIMIHGTDDPSSIGKPVSHGCIRLPADMLANVYRAATVGTDVYIFESDIPQQASSDGKPEHHSDLDYQ